MSPVVVGAGPNETFQPLDPGRLSYAEGILPPGVLPTIERCWYQDPNGNITDLSTDMDRRFKEGIEGRFMAPIQHLSDSVPEADGEQYRGTRALARSLAIPMTYVGDDTTTARATLRALARGVNPKKRRNGVPTVGKLYVMTDDGLYRYISCLYEAGLESNTEPTSNQATYLYTDVRSVLLVFRAFDPFWYDVDSVKIPVEQTVSTATFFPAPPFRLGPSTVYSAFTVDNMGDVESWPVWTLIGPGENPRLVNETTGESILLTLTLTPGQHIVIDTRPGRKTVTLDGLVNLYPYLTGDLWSLDDGENDVRIEMINTTSDSQVLLEFNQRYQSV